MRQEDPIESFHLMRKPDGKVYDRISGKCVHDPSVDEEPPKISNRWLVIPLFVVLIIAALIIFGFGVASIILNKWN